MVNTTPIVGLPQFSGWSQVFSLSFAPGLDCVCTVSVTGPQAGVVGRVFIEDLTQAPPRSAQELYATVELAIQRVAEHDCTPSLVLIFFTETQSTIITYDATVLLKRESKVGKIILPEKEIHQVEGKLHADDIFIALSKDSVQFIETIEQQFHKGFDADGVVTAVIPAVHGQDDSSTTAIAFMSVPAVTASPAVVQGEQRSTQRVREPSIPVTPLQQTGENGLNTPEIPSPLSEKLHTVREDVRDRAKRLRGLLVQVSGAILHIFSGKTRVETVFTRKRIRVALVILGLVVVVASVTGGIFIKQRLDTKAAEEVVAGYTETLTKLREAAVTDPVATRGEIDALLSSLQQLQADQKDTASTAQKTVVAALISDVDALQKEISGKEAVAELPIFYDLRLAAPDLLTTVATLVGNTAVFIDSEKQTAILLDLNTKQVRVQVLPQLATARSIAALDESSAVVLSKGIYKLDTTAPETLTELKPEGDSNREGRFIAGFGSYLYVFNPEKRNLYRYASQETGYSDPIGWLRDPLGVPYESITSLAIDGEVWLGTEDGQIKRFQSGAAATFSISGLEQPLEHAVRLVTTETASNVYVLERDAARIIILSKEGQFIKQLESNSLAAVTELLVSEEKNALYAVSGSLIYEILL